MKAARLARSAGFAFVDIKHCHGYLGHEFLSAVDSARPLRRQPGEPDALPPRQSWPASAPRRRAWRSACASASSISCRSSPARTAAACRWRPVLPIPTPSAATAAASASTWTNRPALLDLLAGVGDRPGLHRRRAVRTTTRTSSGRRPFPPSDGYQPPEDPLAGVARQIAATARLKARHPRLTIVGSAYSYLQEWLPHVGQRVLRDGGADFIGLGRMMLSYPELPADVLAGRPLVANACAAPSATAPRHRATAWCRAAIRSIRSTRNGPNGPSCGRAQ